MRTIEATLCATRLNDFNVEVGSSAAVVRRPLGFEVDDDEEIAPAEEGVYFELP